MTDRSLPGNQRMHFENFVVKQANLSLLLYEGKSFDRTLIEVTFGQSEESIRIGEERYQHMYRGINDTLYTFQDDRHNESRLVYLSCDPIYRKDINLKEFLNE